LKHFNDVKKYFFILKKLCDQVLKYTIFYDYTKNLYFIKYRITFRNIMIDDVKT